METKNICFWHDCENETNNPKFCSRSCSAKHSNHISPKRQKTRVCKKCKSEKIISDATYCSKCWYERRIELGKVLDPTTTKNSEVSKTCIYQHARKSYNKSERPKYCTNCGYDKSYQVCHIKAVADFSADTYLSEINHMNNLIALCRNCHWELDNGLLTL